MVKLTIDNKTLKVKEGIPLIDALRDKGINIPSLCYVKGLPHYTSCMVCMVKDKHSGKFIPSCSAMTEKGMDIDATGEEVIKLRRQAVELLLAEHRAECEAPCSRVCPMGLDIPAMNRLVAEGELEAAARLIYSELILPGVACTICPAYCENACRRKMIDERISIREIIRYTSSVVKTTKIPDREEVAALLPGFDPGEAMAGAEAKDKKAIRKMAEAKREGLISAIDGEAGQGKIPRSSFNSTLGKISDEEKKEWMKECAPGGARWNGIVNETQLAEEAAACMHCDCRAKDDCRLRDLADELNAANPRQKMLSHPIEKKINSNTRLIFENAKCIKCGICVRMSTDETKSPSLCFTGRGFMTLLSEPLAWEFNDVLRTGLDEIIRHCPTGALAKINKDEQ
ncbi:MAG: 2Fe-2S iron-sulfur cluster-binding protein [Bacteroidales bacterium]|jgi:predicted molibdopterin-dependent oxidoreductase YjgC|nr:2Fe-2S iron-sulfur cluster-binding protein [Bacteroidales bacterium]